MNMDLLNYIEQARKAGMGDDKIREGLLQSGWPANDINEAMIKVPEVIVPQAKPKAMMSKVSFAVILAIISIAVAGYFAGAYFMAQFQDFPLWPFEAPVAPVTTFTPRPSKTPMACTEEAKLCPDGSAVGRTGPNCEFALCPGEADTSTWKTYSNTQYGFEFKYPGDWSQGSIVMDKAGIVWINFNTNSAPGETNNTLYVKIFPSQQLFDIENNILAGKGSTDVTIDGVMGKYYGNSENILSASVANKNLYIQIGDPSGEGQLMNILSTFRFTK